MPGRGQDKWEQSLSSEVVVKHVDSLFAAAVVLSMWCGFFSPAAAEPSKARRAAPPVWTESQRAIFPDDARTLLVGPRPDFGALSKAQVASGGEVSETSQATRQWSELISTDTLETEIKRQAAEVGKLTQSSTGFKGGGYRQAREAFSVLAVMFALSAQHDARARWRDSAAGLSAAFARAAANCKVGTDSSYREAAARSEDLAELVRGGRPNTPAPPAERNWGDVADRSPLMARMEVAQQKRLKPLTGSAREFSRGAEDALHEAEVLAALAEVIIQEGFDDAGDETYDAFARELRDAAKELSAAAEQDNYESARQALGRAGQACAACHENYRG